MPGMDNARRLLIRLTAAEHTRLKTEAATRGTTMKNLILTGLKIGGILPAQAVEIPTPLTHNERPLK